FVLFRFWSAPMAPTFVFTELNSIASHPFWRGSASFGWRAIFRRRTRRKARARHGERSTRLFFQRYFGFSSPPGAAPTWLTPAARHMLPGSHADEGARAAPSRQGRIVAPRTS